MVEPETPNEPAVTGGQAPQTAPPGSGTEQVEKRKEELFERLNRIIALLKLKRAEENDLRAEFERKAAEAGFNVRELRREHKRLEFRIATEATTLDKERAMMKEMRALEKQLAKASEVEKVDRALRLVLGDIRAAETEIDQVKRDIDAAKSEIRAVREDARDQVRAEREKEWQEKKRVQLMAQKVAREKEAKSEIAPFLGGIDETGVDLGSIAVIKKKES